jgi:hypothetical protein
MSKKNVLSPNDEDFGFTKFNVWGSKIHLPYDVFFDSLGKYRKSGVKPFVMIHTEDYEDWLYIAIAKRPYVIKGNTGKFPEYEKVMTYVQDNYEIILKHWKGKLDDCELGNLLIRGTYD